MTCWNFCLDAMWNLMPFESVWEPSFMPFFIFHTGPVLLIFLTRLPLTNTGCASVEFLTAGVDFTIRSCSTWQSLIHRPPTSLSLKFVLKLKPQVLPLCFCDWITYIQPVQIKLKDGLFVSHAPKDPSITTTAPKKKVWSLPPTEDLCKIT